MEPTVLTVAEIIPRRLFEGVYLISPEGDEWEKRYLVQTSRGNMLVDTPLGGDQALDAVRALGGAQTLFITHRDTVGDAWLFHERLGVSVVIHADDADYVTGCPVDRPLHDGDHLSPDARVIHAPGHSPGSCALLLEREGGILFSGDVVITDADGELRFPLDGYSEDPRRAHHAAARLLRHPFEALLPAHGVPILTGAHERLEALVAKQ